MWSFRLANLLVGNAGDAAGLEIQFLGPTLRFEHETTIEVVAGPNDDHGSTARPCRMFLESDCRRCRPAAGPHRLRASPRP